MKRPHPGGDSDDDGTTAQHHHQQHHPAYDSTSHSPASRQHSQSHREGTANASALGLGDYHHHAAGSRKKSASSRTGQACDRCKVRKIRCDARPGGCSPCIQNNTECKTTDRITGRATSRGHTEHLENENAQLKMYMVELQAQLRENGIDPKPVTSGNQYYAAPPPPQWNSSSSWDAQQNGSSSAPPRGDRETSVPASHLPDFRAGCIGDNYLGVSSENTWLSPIEGTSLALFGTKVDLAEFMPSENDTASIAMSYHTFLSYAFGRTKPYVPPLPAYSQCKTFSEWYFRSVQNFIPILHKPDFMDLLDRIHHKNHHPNPAETVMVHMVLAVINFQFSARNANEQARQDAMHHFHYSLSFVPELVTGHKLEDIQALTMICSQLRNQPRPGAAWMFTNMVLSVAIELGLHRSAKAWPGPGLSRDPHYLEMRKRVFWSLLLLDVHLSGKLGRPMPLRLEDFDIEMPEPLPDDLPGESAPTKWKQCSWSPAPTAFRLLKIMTQVYASIYSIKSTGQYETTVRSLEKELEAFQASIPPELQGGPQTTDEDRVSALYIEISAAECQLLLHHPSLCRSTSQQVIANNLDICLHASAKMLAAAEQLKALKSLDTTWYYATDFLAAIFTTLFASNERRDQMTSADLQRLRHDMNQWLEVMGEVGSLLGTLGTDASPRPGSPTTAGSGPRLQKAIGTIIDFSLTNINRHIAAKTASAAVASTASPPAPAAPQQNYDTPNGSSSYFPNGSNTSSASAPSGQGYTTQNHENTSTYPAATPATQFSYQQPQNYNNYDASAYSDDAKPSLEAQLVAHNASISHQPQHSQQGPAQSNFTAAFQTVPNSFQQTPVMNGQPFAGPAAWRNFADHMMQGVHGVNGHEYMTSANALMSLGGDKPADMSNTQQWPHIHYGRAGDGH